MRHLWKFLSDLFMGPDGETWAIGRIYTIPILLAGLGIPFYQIYKGQQIDLSALGVELGAIVAALTGLISLTNHIDNPLTPVEKDPKA